MTITGVNGAVAIIVGLLTLVLLVGTIVTVVRAGLASGDIKALREDRDDLQERVTRLEAGIAERERDLTALRLALDGERESRASLEKVVTGREQLDHLQVQLDIHDKRVDALHSGHERHADARHDKLVTLLADARRDLLTALESLRAAEGRKP